MEKIAKEYATIDDRVEWNWFFLLGTVFYTGSYFFHVLRMGKYWSIWKNYNTLIVCMTIHVITTFTFCFVSMLFPTSLLSIIWKVHPNRWFIHLYTSTHIISGIGIGISYAHNPVLYQSYFLWAFASEMMVQIAGTFLQLSTPATHIPATIFVSVWCSLNFFLSILICHHFNKLVSEYIRYGDIVARSTADVDVKDSNYFTGLMKNTSRDVLTAANHNHPDEEDAAGADVCTETPLFHSIEGVEEFIEDTFQPHAERTAIPDADENHID
jgi:hypothetical protein